MQVNGYYAEELVRELGLGEDRAVLLCSGIVLGYMHVLEDDPLGSARSYIQHAERIPQQLKDEMLAKLDAAARGVFISIGREDLIERYKL